MCVCVCVCVCVCPCVCAQVLTALEELVIMKELEAKMSALEHVQTEHDLKMTVQAFSACKASIVELLGRCKDATKDLQKAFKQHSKTKSGGPAAAEVETWKVFSLDSPAFVDVLELGEGQQLDLTKPMLVHAKTTSKASF